MRAAGARAMRRDRSSPTVTSYSAKYASLADALLGSGVRPFEGFTPPADMTASYWYGSVFASTHKDLAQILVDYAGPTGWVLELGSFIGNSATTWANAAKRRGWDTPVVCIDTWLGDVIMNDKRKRVMPGADGQPRLYEQFMLNVFGKNASSHVVPLRLPASIGLEYLQRKVLFQLIDRPAVIYLDTAHTYPETMFELELAWNLLPPGGYLTGDDYTHYFAPVQQAVNEFVSSKPKGTFAEPVTFAMDWGKKKKMRQVSVLPSGGSSSAPLLLPMILRLPGQWVVRKPLLRANVSDEQAGIALGNTGHAPLRCCLNGWADPPCRKDDADCKQQPAHYTTCKPSAGPFRQTTCHLPGGASECARVYACHQELRTKG